MRCTPIRCTPERFLDLQISHLKSSGAVVDLSRSEVAKYVFLRQEIKVLTGHRTPPYHVVIYVSESPSATLNSFNANSFQACLISSRIKNSIQSMWLWSRASGKRRQRTSL